MGNLAPDTDHPRRLRKHQPKHSHIIFAATRSQITRRDDDREQQTEQTIIGARARKLRPPECVRRPRGLFGALSVYRIEQRPRAFLPHIVVISQLKPKRLSRVDSCPSPAPARATRSRRKPPFGEIGRRVRPWWSLPLPDHFRLPGLQPFGASCMIASV